MFNNYGHHKRSRFGGLPIPIPIPIPIPLGGFGGFGGHSYNHRVLNSFVKDRNMTTSDNETTSVFVLNNSTVTPCTTDQFIYESLNVTVMSCTAGNCTAVKVFTTTATSGEVTTHSAGLTVCLEPEVTFSSFADNVNPTVSDVHRFWMRVCRELVPVEAAGNITEDTAANVTLKITETVLNETVVTEPSQTNLSTTTESLESTTTPTLTSSTESPSTPTVESSTLTPTLNETSTVPSTSNSTNSSFCEVFDCSWIEMCLPTIELVDKCFSADCPFTRTGYRPCIRVRMCKSPSTPISTFATLNTTISRIDQYNNVTSVYDVANLTLISYFPEVARVNCSQNATDPACQPAPVNLNPEGCPTNSSAGSTDTQNSGTLCVPLAVTENLNSTGIEQATPGTTTETSTAGTSWI